MLAEWVLVPPSRVWEGVVELHGLRWLRRPGGEWANQQAMESHRWKFNWAWRTFSITSKYWQLVSLNRFYCYCGTIATKNKLLESPKMYVKELFLLWLLVKLYFGFSLDFLLARVKFHIINSNQIRPGKRLSTENAKIEKPCVWKS